MRNYLVLGAGVVAVAGAILALPSLAQTEQPPVEIPIPEPAEPLSQEVELPPPPPPVEPEIVPPPSDVPPPEVIIPGPSTGTAPTALGVVLGGIDKIAARTAKFEVNLRQQAFYNTLIVKAHACKTRPPEEPPESAAFLEIQERKSDGTIQKIFSGWMFASSPALNALEHPVYDIWVVSCKTAPAANTSPVPPNS